jgi:hypothetical protein
MASRAPQRFARRWHREAAQPALQDPSPPPIHQPQKRMPRPTPPPPKLTARRRRLTVGKYSTSTGHYVIGNRGAGLERWAAAKLPVVADWKWPTTAAVRQRTKDSKPIHSRRSLTKFNPHTDRNPGQLPVGRSLAFNRHAGSEHIDGSLLKGHNNFICRFAFWVRHIHRTSAFEAHKAHVPSNRSAINQDIRGTRRAERAERSSGCRCSAGQIVPKRHLQSVPLQAPSRQRRTHHRVARTQPRRESRWLGFAMCASSPLGLRPGHLSDVSNAPACISRRWCRC